MCRLALPALALGARAGGFDSLPDPGELFDVALCEPVEEMRADRGEVRRGGGLKLGAPGVRHRYLGRARVGRAALSLDQPFALETDRDPRHLAGAEPDPLGQV